MNLYYFLQGGKKWFGNKFGGQAMSPIQYFQWSEPHVLILIGFTQSGIKGVRQWLRGRWGAHPTLWLAAYFASHQQPKYCCVCVCVRVNVKPRLNLPNCAKRTWTVLSIWEHLILSYITLRKMFITFVSHARSMKLSSYIPASLRLTWTQSTVVVSSWKHV